ncbi:MAG: CpsD/CapB family tyrosine-protein kinase [bacterium]
MLDPLSRAIERAAHDRTLLRGENLSAGEPGVREYVDMASTSREPDQNTGLETLEYTQTPVLTLPSGGQRPEISADSAEGIAARGFDILKTKVLHRLEQQRSNMLVVTSPTKNNGKTNTAVHLAASIARSVDQTVLLVDLDLRHPSVHEYFGVTPDLGVTDLIKGEATFSEVAFNPGVPRLVVLPGRESVLHSTEFLSTPAIKRFIDEVRDRYPQRIIVFDMPPVLGGADVLSFMPYVNNYLLIAEAGATSRKELAEAKKTLSGSTIIGTVLNKSQESQDTYY